MVFFMITKLKSISAKKFILITIIYSIIAIGLTLLIKYILFSNIDEHGIDGIGEVLGTVLYLRIAELILLIPFLILLIITIIKIIKNWKSFSLTWKIGIIIIPTIFISIPIGNKIVQQIKINSYTGESLFQEIVTKVENNAYYIREDKNGQPIIDGDRYIDQLIYNIISECSIYDIKKETEIEALELAMEHIKTIPMYQRTWNSNMELRYYKEAQLESYVIDQKLNKIYIIFGENQLDYDLK